MAVYQSIYQGPEVDASVGRSYVPTLNAAPTSSTLTFSLDGNTVDYAIGQMCRVADSAEETGYKFYQLYDITGSGNNKVAHWQAVGSGGGSSTDALNVEVTMSDNDDTDLADVAITIAINGGSPIPVTGTVDTVTHKKTFTVELEFGDTYVVAFGDVEGYLKPSNISGTKSNTSVTWTAEYETDIYTLSSIVTTKNGNVQGTNPQGAGVTVAYTGQTAPATLTAINDTVKVPSNLTPTITAETVYGYTATATESSGSITLTYATIAYTLNVGTNQASNTDIASTVIRVSATGISANGYLDFTGAQSSVEVLVPSGVNPTAACQSGAPSANEYAESITVDTTNHTITALYSTEVLTISITKDAGDGDLSTCSVAVTTGGTTLGTLTNASPTLKIAYGINYTCTPSALAGYTAPAAVTKNWADTTAKSLTFEYIEQAGFVDLGLPSGKKWAVGNIISDGNGGYKVGEETDYGAYFSWGNIVPHFSANGSTFDDSYDFGTSNSGPYASTPGASVGANIPTNDAQHDAALALLGSPWHLPTKDDFQELYDNTDNEWTTINGVAGRKFMKKTDHSVYVFFPAAGYGRGTSLRNRGSYGYYWSGSWDSAGSAYGLYFSSSSVSPQDRSSRYYGNSVRAVQ